jgi:ABC-type multidrug transport system fused ATPase/permease subunit
VERCNTFLEIDQEKYFKCDNDELLKNNFPLNGKVEFRNYSVKYRPDTPIVLNNLNFILNPHEKIGVVGRTGSGKSTLCLCLFRILEAFKGQILIDDIDIKTIGLRLLRQSITIIPQEPVLLEGNIRENVDPLNVYTDSEIENVLQEIGLDHLKLFYPVEENGKNLSVGEKQLICIGRAVLRKTKVVVMDEATSSIDYKTENLIQNVINTTLRDSTVITIAHRIKTVINYDRIMVMSNGELVEFDSPKKLLENPKGIFTGLYKESIGNNENKNGK